MNAEYLGDSVYVQPWDYAPGALALSTGSHNIVDAESVIYLEPEVLSALLRYIEKTKQENQKPHENPPRNH